MPENRLIDAGSEWADPFNLYSGNKTALGGEAPGLSPKTDTSSSLPAGMSQRDWDDTVNTVIAEAAGEGDDGMAGVAHVIRNRSNIRGKSIGDVVREPDQFTGYASPGAKTVEAMRDPAMRARAEGILRNALTSDGPDPTGGADHYHATSVSPGWAGAMPETTRIGQHIYYNSKGEKKSAPSSASAFVPEEDPLGLYGPKGQFRDVLQGDEGKPATQKQRDNSILLTKLQAGKPETYVTAMSDGLHGGLTAMFNEAPDFVRNGLDVLSGARTPERQAQIIADHAGKYGFDRKAWVADVERLGPVEAGKQWRPTFRKLGLTKNIGMPGGSKHQHGEAADLGWNGGAFSKAPKEVVEWVHSNAGRYGLAFPMAHENWHIETADARSGGNANQPAKPKGVEVSDNFKANDPFGMYTGQPNPFEQDAANAAEDRRAAETQAAVEKERQRVVADVAANNDAVASQLAGLEAKTPGRYQEVPESQLATWQEQWDKDNRSSGTPGDLVRRWGAGAANTSQSLDNLGNLLLNKIPGGSYINDALDGIDRWMGGGSTVAEKRQESIDRENATLSPEGAAARDKKWWDDENKTLGPAWTDPRSYLGVIAESGPSTVASMLPSGIIARGAFVTTLAGGASREVAAATAAKTATLAGGITEGLLGGADAANSVRQKITEMPREQLVQSDAVKQLIESGMSEQQAIDAVSNDAQTQALITAGVVTGAFGGMGDRALAKIIAEGVEGGVARRVATGMARGAVAEGIFEEAPQSAGQTIAENAAMRRVNPDQELTEGLGESVASGIAAGGAMGGGMGGAGGLARPAAGRAGVELPPAQPEPDNRGPLRRAADHGQQRETERATAADAGAPIDGRPAAKSTVRVEAEGIEPFMGTVEGYEGDEAVIVDSSSGEMFQVPLANITEIAPPVGDYRFPEKADDGMPELSADPALEPLPPMGSETTSEMPPRSEDMAATDKRPTRPQPGHRVIVDSPEVGRFPARIERYENEGAEALVVDDKGNPFQVPTTALKVSSLTPAQIEAQDLERNPPIEREIGDAGPNSRKIGDATVILPDDNHAALYDLAREQVMAKRLGGTSQVDIDSVLPAERKRLADAFGIKVADLASMADDYRYRAERAAKQAKSKLPFKMNAVNDRLLKQRQSARAKEAGEPLVEPADDGAAWWDVDLTAQDRKRVLEQAGVKRSERLMWQGMTPGIKKKLLDVRDAQRAAADDVATLAGKDEVSAKMRAIADEIGQDDGAVYPDHAEAAQADAAANEAATSPTNDLPEPTAAQKEAGNYKVGRLKLGGLDISIENPAGSQRKGVSSSGKAWSVDMKSHYGYIRGTVGRDKDHIDVFVRPGTETLDDSSPVFVVDQKDPARGRFDEHKVMAGFDNEAQARAAYLENYTADWKGLGDISQTTLGDFKTWLKSGKTSEPFAPKWFASQDKADGYIARNNMGETHEVVQRGKRFEILERRRDVQDRPSSPANEGPTVTDRNGRRYQTKGEKLPEKGLAPANVGSDGLVYVGEIGSQHFVIADKHHDAAPFDSVGFVTPDGDFLDRKQALEWVNTNERPVRTGSNMGEELDALDYRDQVPSAVKAAKGGTKAAKAKPAVSTNTIFTDDAAAKARELLRKKLSGNTLNSGIDPELLQAGITLAGYHIEKGARTFAAYASAMLADLGEGARPYLKSWYAATILDPRFSDIEGMTPLAELTDIDIDAITARQAEALDGAVDGRETSEGPFGPILRGYEGKWREAALELERRQTGDAIAALSHPDVGPIDLVWGTAGSNQNNGAGLAKLIAWHPEVLDDLQGFINRLSVDERRSTNRRIQLSDASGNAGVRLDFDGTAKTWLLTAYETGQRRTERSSRRLGDLWGGRETAPSSPLEESAGKSARSDTASTDLSDAIASRQTNTQGNVAPGSTDVQSIPQADAARADPDEYDRPKANKRRDEAVEGTRNDLVHVGLPSAPEGPSKFDWARDTISRFGKKGHEYLMAVDDDGAVVEFGSANRKASTGINNKLLGAMLNPDRRLVVFHNHPRGGPLSADDIAMLALPGMHSVWSFTPAGTDMRAALTPEAEAALFSTTDHFAKMREISTAIADARNDVSDFLADKVREGAATPQQAEEAHNFASVMVAHRAGLIDITSEKNYNVAAIDGLNSRLDSAAAAIRESIDDGKANYSGERVSRRSARDFRHVAEVAGLARRGERVASGRSGPEGLSEAGPSNYQGEVGEWRKLVQDFSDVKATRENIVSRLRGVIADNKSSILATVPLNYFPELAGDKIPAINDYLLIKRKMDAYRSGRHDAAAEVMDRWRKYISTGFLAVDKSKSQALADLMHDATLAGIDPSLTTEEERAKPGYDRLRKRFTAIAPIGQKLFTDVRDAYREQADELDRLLLDNVRKAQEMAKQQAEREFKARLADIEASDLNPIDRRRRVEDAQNKHKAAMTKSTWASKARMTQLRVMFESNRVPDPYFPLARFGDYFVSVKTPRKDEAGDIVGYDVLHFSRHEKAREMEQALAELRSEFPDAMVTSGMLSKGGELKSAMDPRVVGELDKLLASANVGDDIRDALYQRWLQTMPDLSMRKRAIHRKGIAGYNTDAFRVFASTTFHAAHQMARLKYGLELQENVNLAEEQAKAVDHNQKEMALVNELFKRHQWTLNPTTKPLTNWITGAAFVYFLGATPAAALVNASQTIMVGVPVLSAKFGFARSSSELVKATREFTNAVIKETKTAEGLGDFFKNAGDLRNASSLTGDERAAMEAFYESGLIDRTQSHDLAAVGETGTKYNPVREKVMNVVSYGFHKVEVFNRTVTAIAAYRLAREAGQSHLDAINSAHDLTYKTHFDMSNSSRPRVTQGDIPRLATMFRSFQINMLYRLFRDIHQSLKGESKQVRREARLQLAGVTGMMALNAGLTGTVGYGLAMAAGGILKSMFGDDDDPLDFEERFRSDILELLGPELGGIVLKGVPGHYLGIDLTSRIGMPDLWWRSESRELNSDDALKEFVYQNLGAGFGIVRNTYNGVDLALQGNVERGFETAAPKFIRDALRTIRYTRDGVESIRGDQVIAPDDLSAWNLASQAMGFTPAKIADAYEVNTILRNAEQRIKDRKKSIVNRFAKAVEDGDDEARQKALDDIGEYNAGAATRLDPITAKGLKQSLRMRVRNRQRSVGGVLIRNEALNQYLRGEVAGARAAGDDDDDDDVEESGGE